MFGFLKKQRQPSTLDQIARAMYGDQKKTADVQQAVHLAMDLLAGAFDRAELARIADQLNSGPMPYSTHDLAVSVALNRFKSVAPDDRHTLFSVQLKARMTVFSWFKDGQVHQMLAQAFEDTLYRDYKPIQHVSHATKVGLDPIPARSTEDLIDDICAQAMEHEKQTIDQAIVLARDTLLEDAFEEADLRRIAATFDDDPLFNDNPLTTLDPRTGSAQTRAVYVALRIFVTVAAEHREALFGIQLRARGIAHQWVTEGTLSRPLYESFETTLSDLYRQ